MRNVGFENWSVANDGESALQGRRDFRGENAFTIDPNGSKELDDAIHFKLLEGQKAEVGVHVADVAHFIKANSLVDREAKKRGTAVYLMNRAVNMLPPRLSTEICCLNPGEDRYTVSVIFTVDLDTGKVSEEDTWVGKGIIKSCGKISYDQVDSVLGGNGNGDLDDKRVEDIRALHVMFSFTTSFRLRLTIVGSYSKTPSLEVWRSGNFHTAPSSILSNR